MDPWCWHPPTRENAENTENVMRCRCHAGKKRGDGGSVATEEEGGVGSCLLASPVRCGVAASAVPARPRHPVRAATLKGILTKEGGSSWDTVPSFSEETQRQ